MIIFGVDVDDTVLDLVGNWLTSYNEKYDDNVQRSDIKNWEIHSFTKLKNDREAFFKLLNPSLYEDIQPIPGAVKGIRTLRTMGRVVFVTSNFGDIGRPKLEALNRLGFEVEKEDYIEASDKSLIATHYLFDDRYDNVVTAYGQGVLFETPWNKEIDFSPRVSTWTELIDFVRGAFA